MKLTDPALTELVRLGFGRVTSLDAVPQDTPGAPTVLATAAHGKALIYRAYNARESDALKAEAESLRTLRSATMAAGLIRVPRVLSHGETSHHGHFLLLEHLPLRPIAEADAAAVRLLGEGIASLHLAPQPPGQVPAWMGPAFGFSVDTHLGGCPQRNAWARYFHDFFCDNRLRPDLEQAEARLLAVCGEDSEEIKELRGLSESLLSRAAELLAPLVEPPALLHGNLISASCATVSGSGNGPALVDPACWYGLPEVDLATLRLAGGLGEHTSAFFEGYDAVRPRGPGSDERTGLFVAHQRVRSFTSLPEATVRSGWLRVSGAIRNVL